MNTHKLMKWVKRVTGLMTAVMLTLSMSGNVHARILFEDDAYFNILSEGIILDFNNDVTPGTQATATVEGGTYTAVAEGTAGNNIDIVIVDGANCDITTPGNCTTVVGDVITITADLDDANGDDTDTDPVTSAMIVAEINAYAPAAALVTASGGDATSVTAQTIDLATGTDGDDIEIQLGNDGTDATITYNDSVQDLVISTPGGDIDFTDDNLTTTGGLLFQDSSEFHIRETSDYTTETCTTVGEIILDTSDNRILVCTVTGSPGTWVGSDSGSSQDFDDVYDLSVSNANLTMEIDNGTLNFNITTADSFAIQDGGVNIGEFTGAGAVLFDPTSGQNFDVTTLGTGDIVLNSADDIDVDAATFNLDTTGAFSLDGVGASNITTDTGNLSLTTTTSGDVDITGIDNVDVVSTNGDITLTGGDDIIFDDGQITGIIQLSDTDTDWDATFSGNGIIDNINSFTSTAAGEGASNVGIEDASTWFTGAEIEAALNEIEALFGSTTSSTYDFTEDNVLADNDPVYAALNKLDLKWGDLASVATGEGASLVGIEDAGTYYTSTDVEGALQEIGADLANEYEDLRFFPEFEDATVFPDGSDNKGTLEALYDSTEETGYYNWTTTRAIAQDIDIRMHFVLPSDFASLETGDDFTYRYRTGTTTEADNDVEITFYNVTDAATCGSDTTNGSADVWSTGTITAATLNAGCAGISAGDIIEIQIKLIDTVGAGDYADIGWINLEYTK